MKRDRIESFYFLWYLVGRSFTVSVERQEIRDQSI
jgi:hypothetical protein